MRRKQAGFKRGLVISDLHAPFMHPDAVSFLSALKDKYDPDYVVLTGDEADFSAISYHEHDPNLPSPGDELELTINQLNGIYKLFPKADVLDSNHGSLVHRKSITAGLPSQAIRSSREILKAPSGWNWKTDVTVKMSDGKWVYGHHSKGGNALKVSQSMGMSYFCGHHHNKLSIEYWGNSLGLYWGMVSGSLINDKARAFNYNKLTMQRPIIGCAVIIDGQPRLEPLLMDASGRWIERKK